MWERSASSGSVAKSFQGQKTLVKLLDLSNHSEEFSNKFRAYHTIPLGDSNYLAQCVSYSLLQTLLRNARAVLNDLVSHACIRQSLYGSMLLFNYVI